MGYQIKRIWGGELQKMRVASGRAITIYIWHRANHYNGYVGRVYGVPNCRPIEMIEHMTGIQCVIYEVVLLTHRKVTQAPLREIHSHTFLRD